MFGIPLMEIPVVYTALLCFATISLFLLSLRRKRPANYPPGPMPLPILGNIHQLGKEPHKSLIRLGQAHGPIFAMDFASFPAIVVNDYKAIHRIANEPALAGRPKFRPLIKRYGEPAGGIVMSEESIWSEQRTFVIKYIRNSFLRNNSFDDFVEGNVVQVVETVKQSAGRPISTENMFTIGILNSIWEISTGEKFDPQDTNQRELLDGVTESLKASGSAYMSYFFPTLSKLAPELTGYNNLIRLDQQLADLVKLKLAEHKESYDPSITRDLMDAFLHQIGSTEDPASSFYQAEGERNAVLSIVDLYLGGAETASIALTWVLLHLALRPEIQERIYQEIVAVVGRKMAPKVDQRLKMPYTECVLLEVLRFSTFVPFGIFRRALEDVRFDGYSIPSGTLVIPNFYAASRDPVWGDPDTFRPERFLLPDGSPNLHHEALLIFSAGKRICLGKKLAQDQIFLYTTRLVQGFQICPDPTQPVPTTDSIAGLILCPQPHKLVFNRRNQERL